MNKKVWIFWSIVVFGFVMAIFLSLFIGAETKEDKDITLDFDADPGVFYRTDVDFHVNVNSFGNQSFSYFSNYSDLKKFKYLQFADVDISIQYQVLLQIKKGRRVLFQDEMIKGSGLMLELPWNEFKDKIVDKLELKITIFPQIELGMLVPEKYDMGFSAIKLLPDSFSSRLDYVNTWLLHQPNYSLSSLNYWQKQGFPLPTALAVLVWLSTVLICAWFLKISNFQLMLLLMLLILPISMNWAVKQLQLKQLSLLMFDDKSKAGPINGVDNNIKEFSHVFLDWMQLNKDLKSIVVIQTYNTFEQSRLLYHLHSLDVFKTVKWPYIETLKQRKDVDVIYVVISNKLIPECQLNKITEFTSLSDVELIMNQSGYCVIKI